MILLLGGIVLVVSPGAAYEKAGVQKYVVAGIDHLPVVVRNLDSATAFYRKLGFALKPGRWHQNGIRNQHIKFKNGIELELITASQPIDTLTTEYCQSLQEGEGPVFFGLYTPDIAVVARRLDRRWKYERESGAITFPASDLLHPLFLGTRNSSPTDKPEHFSHLNTANSLIGLWLATDNTASYVHLFQHLGIVIRPGKVHTPFVNGTASIATLKEGEVVLLPASFQTVPHHIVIGATVRVSNMDSVKAVLCKGGLQVPALIKGEGGAVSLFLSPELTHGIWLEFRKDR
ncbi:hypothetical protein FLA_3960 [Filimonas lacunae]|nr:hypothetical protein FLA_3960 [Filimonas lacunae]